MLRLSALQRLFHHDGERAVAKAAEKFRTRANVRRQLRTVAGPAFGCSRDLGGALGRTFATRLLRPERCQFLVSGLLTTPAQACKSPPQSMKLCAVVPVSAEVRDAPNGRVAHGASGKVLVAGRSKRKRARKTVTPLLRDPDRGFRRERYFGIVFGA